MSAQQIYKLGDHLFLVIVQRGLTGRGYEAEAYRLCQPRAELVLTPNGSPAASSAPTVWQAVGRMVRLMERTLGPAQQVSGVDLETYSRCGTWQLSEDAEHQVSRT